MSDEPTPQTPEQPSSGSQPPQPPQPPAWEPPPPPAPPSMGAPQPPSMGVSHPEGMSATPPPMGSGEQVTVTTTVTKPSAARYAIIALVVVALGAGAVLVAKNRGGSATISAGSPTAAIESMLGVLSEGRIIDLLRGEFPWMASIGEVDEAALAAGGLPGGRITGLSIAGDNLTYDVQEVGTELAIVSITGGAFKVKVDPAQLPPAMAAAIPTGMPLGSFEQKLPVAMIEQGMCESYVDQDRACPGLEVVTVKDAGGWRLSWMHTMMHLGGSTLEPRNPNGAISAADLEDRIEAALAANDPNGFFDLLDPQEFSWVSDFRVDLESDEDPPSLDLMFEVQEETAESAYLKLAGFELRTIEQTPGYDPDTFEFTFEEREVLTTFDGDCVSRDGREPQCLSSLAGVDLGPFAAAQPILDQLMADGIRFGAVQRDGLWYLSVAKTFEPFAPAIKTVAEEFGTIMQQCQQAFQSFDPSSFDGSSDPFADLPPACAALMMGPLGMLGGMSSGMGMSEQFELTP